MNDEIPTKVMFQCGLQVEQPHEAALKNFPLGHALQPQLLVLVGFVVASVTANLPVEQAGHLVQPTCRSLLAYFALRRSG